LLNQFKPFELQKHTHKKEVMENNWNTWIKFNL